METRVPNEMLSEENRKIRDEIEQKAGKTVEVLYAEREQRVKDAIELKEPDRVPVALGLAYFPGRYAGVPASAAYYDHDAWRGAYKKTIVDFEPDLWRGTPGMGSGTVMEALGSKSSRWPGFNLPPESSHQAIELETLKEDEYDLFLNDPSDYVIRYQLPRVYEALAPLAKLPPLKNLNGMAFAGFTPLFATPEFQKLGEILYNVGKEVAKSRGTQSFEDEIGILGFPPQGHAGGVGGAPFDAISDFYRGMRGAMTDMYRAPDKLLAALDRLLQGQLERAMPADPKKRGNPKRLFIPLHRGAEGFMSNKQFEKFYWPGLKKALLTDIELGYVPMPFLEGRYSSRLEYFLELPKGSTVLHLDQTDMIQAKEVLGDHLCIMGNVPSAVLQVGSVSEVEEYCEKLIKICGKGGGFILTNGSSIDEAKPANIKAMVDSVKKYSVN
jgi:uroporphyrinogen decarboxylase-like protein